jgi:hypothetical protein
MIQLLSLLHQIPYKYVFCIDASYNREEGGQAASHAAAKPGSPAEKDLAGPKRAAEASSAGLSEADLKEQEHFK